MNIRIKCLECENENSFKANSFEEITEIMDRTKFVVSDSETTTIIDNFADTPNVENAIRRTVPAIVCKSCGCVASF